jgi:hypothetical protein
MKTLSAVILIVAAAFLWTGRIQVTATGNGIITYDKWTGHVCIPTVSEVRCLAEITR